ncbi:metal-dependent transcriptional regulator [Candidatus Neomicrothrix sp.]|jgi:DtxR family Mn-dependent transcriptional regulator|uniref:metal-dependent transcriptional regulator n=1 Tax=Candidatus Neomicrothrix sp. TaxID=2719034 RepID=UPI001B731326|nr:metal-dependent transcriptional regulator [Candidatus Microthrix sp.]MBK6309160.1 metal-dependent transcriptional regulator [Candidatus Microthrix sp.]MBK6440213.1 metal-dependent transcriptional regulator [Candidatus Microthrix sp.]MBK6970411.1 metal-dependent transcriptional regulator [Candidatus Microthrix sp.]MBK7163886.1 metal-dependent transcriptional regulator [Candidatus Microthrix sp.]MBP7595055.1 metal-dependent transcriptional regulator [Candidatus Microthrix sp.]
MQTSSRGNARLNEYHPAFEEYCEAIFELHEDDVAVIQARIAERLDVSRPAVSEMVHKMADEGLLTVNRGKIALSVEGMKLAEQVVRRHRLAERFLTDVLGLSWALAHQEAGKWEHVISTPVEDAMAKLLGDPTTCPHGNPIPGSDYRAPDLVALSELAVGDGFTITRIPEELEFAKGMLEFLESHELLPGAVGTLVALSPDGSATVSIDDDTVGIGSFASERIMVKAA